MLRLFTLPTASICSNLLLLSSLVHSSLCLPSLKALPRRAVAPLPINFPASQNWEGVDGTWNTFVLRLGSPEQTVRVIISTASQQTWVVDPRACPDDTLNNQSCAESRGTTFNLEKSSSWKPVGLYDLWIESNLGLVGNAEYAYEKVGLAYPGEGGPTLTGQTVGAIATTSFYFGHFGINPKPTNFTNFTSQSPSYLTSLKQQGQIPSVSWGYTAGAPYRFTKVQGSLTLGGYDAGKTISNGVVFPFAPDNERDILVSLQSLTSIDAANKKTTLLQKPIYAYIDSTVAEIWLPIESCALFEQTFGLTYDSATELYLVSENTHNLLLLTNPNITFNIAPWTQQAGHTDYVNIVLPYSAFDLTAKAPYQNLNRTTRYFPLRRADNDTQFTIGRTFLQEAYLTVDWERQNFSVSQVSWVAGAKSTILPIPPFNHTSNETTTGGTAGGANNMSPLGTAAIAGIAVGVVIILLITAVFAFVCFRKKPPKIDEPTKTVETESSIDSTGTTIVFPKAELPANESSRAEADGDGTFFGKSQLDSTQTAALVESDSKEREVFEMEGDMPTLQEAGGRQLSEKDVIRAREERINGVDIHNSPSSHENHSPASVSPPGTLDSNRRRALLTAGEVIELSPIEGRSIGTHLPISPLDGSEGSHTNLFSALSPISPGGTNSSGILPDPARKRFSYEE
ncbi:acid protease [Venturia nashicola]|uniref:Acid protease n=1 Tax=Venturia nashicola TaxID=86259 RepID=A0A4Z1P122_9PEZI|nr:acid protease [Venturia nashicola]TLD18225.1 acid protease [Venturia nashicola]